MLSLVVAPEVGNARELHVALFVYTEVSGLLYNPVLWSFSVRAAIALDV